MCINERKRVSLCVHVDICVSVCVFVWFEMQKFYYLNLHLIQPESVQSNRITVTHRNKLNAESISLSFVRARTRSYTITQLTRRLVRLNANLRLKHYYFSFVFLIPFDWNFCCVSHALLCARIDADSDCVSFFFVVSCFSLVRWLTVRMNKINRRLHAACRPPIEQNGTRLHRSNVSVIEP